MLAGKCIIILKGEQSLKVNKHLMGKQNRSECQWTDHNSRNSDTLDNGVKLVGPSFWLNVLQSRLLNISSLFYIF